MQKLTDQDPETQSADLVAGNIALLQSLFPEAFTEGKVDFEVLKQLLGSAVDDREEKYGLNWHGKRRARQIALTPSIGTLRPCPEESVNWDTTQNLMIEGDNLEVLKLLQKSYAGKVKLIYIDPPYNTGNDFVYPDDFRDNIQNYLELTGQVESGKKISTNTETNGRFHTDWLNMIYPRLYLARNLLANTGLILIHIDEHESENLRLVLNEIFGVENDLGEIIWDKKNPKGDSTKIASQHEKILAYAKNLSALKESSLIKRPKANAEKMIAKAAQLIRKVGSISIPSDLEEVSRKYDLDFNVKAFAQAYTLDDARREYREWLAKQDVSGGEAAYKYIDDDGEIFRTVSMAWPNKKTAPDEYFEPLIHPVTKKICPVPDRGWRNPPATMAELIKADLIVFGEDETKQPERKYLLKENMEENIPSVLPFGGSDDALLTRLGIPFDNPKPLEFVKSVITYFVGNEGIILDFFAGSATVGHACLELKAEGKSIDFVLVQLPEKLSITKPEQKIGMQFCKKLNVPENIAEIAKERLRRVTVKFTNQTNKKFGFRVFKLDSSNINAWEPNRDDLAGTLHQYAEHLKTDRTEQDILFELLLKLGLNLTVPIEQKTISGKTVHSIGAGTLLTCLAPQISNDEAESLALGLVEWHKQLSPAGETQVVFRDSAFADDVGKTNLTAILQQNGLENVRSL